MRAADLADTASAGVRAAQPAAAGAGLPDALGAWAGAVALVTVADGRDDVGVTVSAFCPLSADPPLVLVSLMSESYPAELFGRAQEPVTGFAVTLLSARQRMLAGRFAAEGRPGARLLLDDVPHQRGPASGALIPDGALAALECAAQQVLPAGDHLLVIARVTGVPYVGETGEPLVRFRGRYMAFPAAPANR
jgi:flavin reductase (DIM6/NTAB) family NADH-FMN oxidoreductase RutF